MSGAPWRAVVPPFRMLDPPLRRVERLLETRLAGVCAALPDERLAALRLNEALVGLGAVPRLRRRGDAWWLTVAGRDRDAEAVTALAVLVAAAGWRRLKRCTRCGRPFLDRTAAITRRGCDRHLARTHKADAEC